MCYLSHPLEGIDMNNISQCHRYLDEKKKKRKGDKMETLPEFPGREKVKFGEVVEAPPKFSFPKVSSLLRTLISQSKLLSLNLFSGLNVVFFFRR